MCITSRMLEVRLQNVICKALKIHFQGRGHSCQRILKQSTLIITYKCMRTNNRVNNSERYFSCYMWYNKISLTDLRFRDVSGELKGTTVSLVATAVSFFNFLFGWRVSPVSEEVTIHGLLSKQVSSKCTEHKVDDLEGTRSFLCIRTNRIHFCRKVSSFGK